MKLFLFLFLPLLTIAQAGNPACPNSTGTSPHCVILSWTAPTSGTTPTGYALYTGGTKAGQCSTPSAATCTKVGTVAAGILTLTQNSSAAQPLTEGATYFYVVTSLNGTAESVPSSEASASIPFLVPNAPAGASATGH